MILFFFFFCVEYIPFGHEFGECLLVWYILVMASDAIPRLSRLLHQVILALA